MRVTVVLCVLFLIGVSAIAETTTNNNDLPQNNNNVAITAADDSDALLSSANAPVNADDDSDALQADDSAASDDSDALQATASKGHHGGKKGGGDHHWGYTQNGQDWNGLCKRGNRQSPIDIRTKNIKRARSDKFTVEFNYEAVSGLKIFNNGHTIQVQSVNGGDSLGYVLSNNGKRYNVLQFHLHAPAEHTVNKRTFPLELHVVHQMEGAKGLNDLLVVGVLFKEGPANAFLSQLNLETLPKKASESNILSGEVDLSVLRALDGNLFAYKGSLTTPPCAETVSWRLMSRVATASREQLAAFEALFAKNSAFAAGRGNNRAVQPRSGRRVWFVRQDFA